MKDQNKPREWIIFDGHTGIPRLVGPDIAYAENVKIIEHSAYESLKQENEKLRETLKFYADRNNWEKELNDVSVIKAEDVELLKFSSNGFYKSDYYGGKLARQTLKDIEGEGELK